MSKGQELTYFERYVPINLTYWVTYYTASVAARGSVRVDNVVFSSKGVGNFHCCHRGKEAALFTRDEASTWNESAIKEEMNRVTNKQQTIHATAGRSHHLELGWTNVA